MAVKYDGIIRAIWNGVSKYNHNKYWTMREYIVSHNDTKNIKAWFYLYRIKKADAYYNASFGTHIGHNCAKFAGRPILPHGINGIIISNDCEFGQNCTIYHRVTIAGGNGGSPRIGNNVLFGANATVIGSITIGDNVKIGAGCVVAESIPSDTTVVMPKPRVIWHNEEDVMRRDEVENPTIVK